MTQFIQCGDLFSVVVVQFLIYNVVYVSFVLSCSHRKKKDIKNKIEFVVRRFLLLHYYNTCQWSSTFGRRRNYEIDTYREPEIKSAAHLFTCSECSRDSCHL